MKTFLFASLLFLSATLYAEAGKVFYSKGDVTITSKDKSKTAKAKKGLSLELGDVIKAGPKSLAIVYLKGLNGGSKIKVNANSEIQVRKIQGMEKARKTSVLLRAGSAFVKVLKEDTEAGEKFILRTRSTSMGVRGTEFFAAYGKSEADGRINSKTDVWMCVNEGLVAIKAKDKKIVEVKAGEGVRVKKGKKTSKPRPLAWTRKLNWAMDPKEDLVNKVNIEEAYYDLLDQDYD